MRGDRTKTARQRSLPRDGLTAKIKPAAVSGPERDSDVENERSFGQLLAHYLRSGYERRG